MMNRIPHAALLAAAITLAGCGEKKPAPGLTPVAEAGRSPAFSATVAKLDLGGPVFLFADTQGDPKRVADALLALGRTAAQQPGVDPVLKNLPANIDPYLADLGLDNIHAIGVSSRIDGVGFVNKSFLYTPGGPKGLGLLFGSTNKPFAAPRIAPANTLFVAEGVFEADKLVAVVRAAAGHAMGEAQAKAQVDKLLATQIPNAPYTVSKLLERLSGRAIIGVQVRPGESVSVSEKVTLPAIDLTLALDDRTALFDEVSALAGMAGQNGAVEIGENADTRYIRIKATPVPQFARYRPVIALHKASGRVFISTNDATLGEWTGAAGKLADDAKFKAAAAGLTAEGTSLCYVSSDLGDVINTIFAALEPTLRSNEDKQALAVWKQIIEGATVKGATGLYAATRIEADGYYSESRSPYSEKPNAYLWASKSSAGIVVTVGGMAALAIPAFKKVRNNAIEKTLINDARQLSSAAQQYMSENATTSVTLKNTRPYFPSLSSGNKVGVLDDNGTYVLRDYLSLAGGALRLKSGGKFILSNPNYDRSMSSNPRLAADTATEKTAIVFEVDSGAVTQP